MKRRKESKRRKGARLAEIFDENKRLWKSVNEVRKGRLKGSLLSGRNFMKVRVIRSNFKDV